MSKILVLCQGRMGSSRLPNKVTYELAGKPSFVHVLERVQEYLPDADYYFVNTTYEVQDDPLALLARAYGYDVFRYTEATGVRIEALFRHLRLKDDDRYIAVSGDSPFIYCKPLPFMVERALKTGRKIIAVVKPQTILWATQVIGVQAVGHYRAILKDSRRRVVTDAVATYVEPDLLPIGLVTFPAKFGRPWPWGPVNLDFPVQALQIKQIYDALYQGKPIDIWEVYDLLLERPHLAHLVPVDTLLATNPQFPHGARGLDIEQIKQCGDYITMRWKGGGEI